MRARMEDQSVPVVLTSIAAFVILIGFVARYLRSASHGGKDLPGSLGWPLLGEDREFFSSFSHPERGVYDFVHQRHQKYGSIFKTKLLGTPTVVISDREAIKQVINGDFVSFLSTSFRSTTKLLGENGLICVTSEEMHKKLRQLGGEPISQEELTRFLGKFEEIALDILGTWEGRTVRVLDETTDFSFSVIGCIIMSYHPGPELENMKLIFEEIFSGFSSFPYRFPGSKFSRAMEARGRLSALFLKTIDQRRSGEVIEDDFLQQMVKREAVGSQDSLTDVQLVDHLILVLTAGYETTGNTLMWVIKYLEENPFVLDTLREEHRIIKEQRTDGEKALTWEEAKHMPYTQKSMRLSSSTRWIQRTAVKDAEINGYKVMTGWRVMLDFYGLHHDPALFKDPYTFDPSRFDGRMQPFAFMGFGAGPHMCLGMSLARLEMAIFLHHLVTMYRWEAVEKDNTVAPSIFRKLKNKYPVLTQPIINY